MKEIRINVPEGYEIDRENSTFELIKFKKKDRRAKTWKEYLKKGYLGYYADLEGYPIMTAYSKDTFASVLPTTEDVKAMTALCQLICLRKDWVGEWQPGSTEEIYRIDGSHILYFPTSEMRVEFYDCFKDLIEKAKRFI